MWINSNLFIVASLRSFRCARFEMLRFVRKVFSYIQHSVKLHIFHFISSFFHSRVDLVEIEGFDFSYKNTHQFISCSVVARLYLVDIVGCPHWEWRKRVEKRKERKIWISFHVWTVQIINMTQQQLHESPHIYFNFSSLICPLSIVDRMISSQGW